MDSQDTSASSLVTAGKFSIKQYSSTAILRTGEVLSNKGSHRIELVLHKPSNILWAEKRLASLDVPRLERVAKLSHPHLVQLITYFRTEGSAVMYMEYVSHCVYLDLQVSGTYTETHAASVFRQLCLAVKYLHDNGVVHGDIRSDNVLLDPTGSVKLTICSQPCQEARYSPPRGTCGRAEDFWALGLLLHEMLSNSLPSPALDQSLSKPARDVISTLLAASPTLSLDSVLAYPFFAQQPTEAAILAKLEAFINPLKSVSRTKSKEILQVSRPPRMSYSKTLTRLQAKLSKGI